MEQPRVINEAYLAEHPDHIFVFGDNDLHKGTGGAAHLRGLHNTYGFVTKRAPHSGDTAFYDPKSYASVYTREISRLRMVARAMPDKTFLISKVGAGLANRFRIWEVVIEPRIKTDLAALDNVVFLW